MIKCLAILFFLKITLAEDFHYKYDEYSNEYASWEAQVPVVPVLNKTDKPKPKRVNEYLLNNGIDEADAVGVNYTSEVGSSNQATTTEHRLPTYPKRWKRWSHFTDEVDAMNNPVPDVRDNISTYPFAASVLRMSSHYASGVLVDRQWVLSAAGVFYNAQESIKLFGVRLGSVNCKRGGILLPLQRIVIHPGYMLGKPENDLALLRLAEPTKITETVHPVSLTERKGKIEIGKFLTMYWPRLVVDGKTLPSSAKERHQHTNMRVSTQRVIPWKQCWREMTYRKQILSENSFCLRPLKQFHSICLPDIGAPVLFEDGLWGIISGWVGQPCSFAEPSPVLVSRVSPLEVRYWLESQFELEEV